MNTELIFDEIVMRFDRNKGHEVIDYDMSRYHIGDPEREQADLVTAYTEFNMTTGKEGNTHKVYVIQDAPGIYMKSGGGGGSTTTVQKSDPWDSIQPYLIGGGGKPIYERVLNPNYRSGSATTGKGRGEPQYINQITGYSGGKLGTAPEAERIYRDRLSGEYQGPVLAGPDQTQFDAANAQIARARAGGQLLPQAQAQQGAVIRGDYLDGRKFLEGYGEPITEMVNARFGNTGRSGSAYHGRSLGTELGREAARQYQYERGAQDMAARYAPGLDQADYYDLERMSQGGGVLRDLSQAELDTLMGNQDYDFARQQRALNDYSTIVNAYTGAGGTNSSTSPYYQNRGAGILSGAAAGAGIGQALGLSNPWTAAAAGAGALLGFF